MSQSAAKIPNESVTLVDNTTGKKFEMPLMPGTVGPKVIDVRKPGLFAFRKRGLLNTVRADGCQYFTTVLGPGYNADHADHFHFDIKSRRNGYRACR